MIERSVQEFPIIFCAAFSSTAIISFFFLILSSQTCFSHSFPPQFGQYSCFVSSLPRCPPQCGHFQSKIMKAIRTIKHKADAIKRLQRITFSSACSPAANKTAVASTKTIIQIRIFLRLCKNCIYFYPPVPSNITIFFI